MPIELSIIIVSWNTRDLLTQCIASVYSHAPKCEFQVWVVDNASSDGSLGIVQRQFPQVRLIANRKNVGFARANNQAIRASDGEYLLLLNSDTIVLPGSLQNLYTFMSEHSQAGILGASILNSDRTSQPCFGSFPTVISEAAHSWGLDTRFNLMQKLPLRVNASADWLETDWVLGAALMTRREVIDQVGDLDEEYFMYSEEVDFAYRAKKNGWRTFVLKTAPIIHLGHKSTDLVPDRMKAELFRSKIKYFEKHKGPIPAMLLRSIFASSILAKRWFYLLTGRKAQSDIWAKTWYRFAV